MLSNDAGSVLREIPWCAAARDSFFAAGVKGFSPAAYSS